MEIVEWLRTAAAQVSSIEWVASLLGAISVWLLVKRSVWAFPIGIAMVILYIWIFYKAKLYADMGLQVAFVIMQVQGWMVWARSDKASDERIIVRRFEWAQWLLTAASVAALTPLMGWSLHRYTDASQPYLDSFTTALSLTAQWWMNTKFLENWILWILVDLIYLYQYSVKDLYATVVLYAIFTVMAVLGYREWRAKWEEQGSVG